MVTPGTSHHLRGDSMSPPPQAVKLFSATLSPIAPVQVTTTNLQTCWPNGERVLGERDPVHRGGNVEYAAK
jgi:hypothetical protein